MRKNQYQLGLLLEKSGTKKSGGTKKSEVRSFEERMFINDEELVILVDKEEEIWAMCGLLSFLDSRHVGLRHSGVTNMEAFE